jgi:hypothetical protein
MASGERIRIFRVALFFDFLSADRLFQDFA